MIFQKFRPCLACCLFFSIASLYQTLGEDGGLLANLESKVFVSQQQTNIWKQLFILANLFKKSCNPSLGRGAL